MKTRLHTLARTALALAAMLMLGVCTLGLILGLTPSRHWLVSGAAYFVPAYACLAGLALVLLLALRMHRRATAAAALAIVPVMLIVPIFASSDAAEATAGTEVFRVLTANLYYYNEDPERFLRLVRDTQPDILLLQELDGDHWPRLLAPLEATYPWRTCTPRYPGTKNHLGVYARRACTTRALLDEGIPATLTTLRLATREVNIYNVHTAAPFERSRAARFFAQMEAAARHAAAASGPVIVAGDLNTSLWSHSYRQLLRETGLRSTRQGFGVLGTWPSFAPAALRTPLDHILVSSDFSVAACTVGPQIGSDHLPLLAELHLPIPAATQVL